MLQPEGIRLTQRLPDGRIALGGPFIRPNEHVLIADHRIGVLEQTAVLARARRLLNPISTRLAELGIESQVIVRRDEFQSAPFSWLHSAMRLAAHKTDERVFAALAGAFNQMFECSLSTAEITAQSEAGRVDLFTAWEQVVREEIDIPDALKLAATAGMLHRGELDHTRFASAIIRVFDQWLTDDTPGDNGTETFSVLQEDRAAWHALSGEVGRAIGVSSDLERFLQELDLRSKEPPVGPNTIPLMTIHGAKGNEFDHVYLVGLAEEVLPDFRNIKKGDRTPEFEEERRNCFVAVTRCRETLTISHAEKYSGWNKAPSRFLGEMGLPESTAL